jgi:hypothetical protein
VALRLGLVVYLVVAVGAVAAHGASMERTHTWQLGRGFSATIDVSMRMPGGPFARRTLVVRRRGRALIRFSRDDAGMGRQFADITGDGVKDVLVLDYGDGSGGCGIYRLYGGARFHELWVRLACADVAITRLLGGALVAWKAVYSSQTAATRGQIHCCWSIWRRTEWRWRGGRLVRVRSSLGAPPPLRWRDRLLPGTYPK